MSICKGGEIWVLNTPSEALGFILADAGYEVWIGNTRTTKFSHGHTTFKTQNSVILQSQFNGPFHEKHTFIHTCSKSIRDHKVMGKGSSVDVYDFDR